MLRTVESAVMRTHRMATASESETPRLGKQRSPLPVSQRAAWPVPC